MGLRIDFEFHLDGLASILMVAAAALSASAILFMPHEYKGQEVEQSSFYGWMLVFLAAMIGVALNKYYSVHLLWEALLFRPLLCLPLGDLENRGKIALKYFVTTLVLFDPVGYFVGLQYNRCYRYLRFQGNTGKC